MRFFFGRIFPLIFLLAGAGMLYGGIKSLAAAKQSVSWPVADGAITSSSVERHHGDDNDTFHAAVVYEYAVNGHPCTATRVAFGDYGSSNPSHANGIVARYPVGRKVQVRYSPDDPADAVLEPGIKGQTFVLPVVGLVFFLAGFAMAVYLPRSMNAIRAQPAVAQPSPEPAGSLIDEQSKTL